MSWLDKLRYDPLQSLLKRENVAIEYWVKKDLLHQQVTTVHDALWDLKTPQSILRKQNKDGSWTYPRKMKGPEVVYTHLETWRQLGYLVEKYGFTNEHPSVRKTAEYFFQHQSKYGEFAGFYAKQYSPNFSAALAELLIKAGYSDDPHIEKHFQWLLSIRQDDGGWALPFRTKGFDLKSIYGDMPRVEPELAKPTSWMVTGAVLRAFAAHPKYKHANEAKRAGKLLQDSFFKRDKYPDRASAEYWLRFSFPYDYTHLLSALDSLSLLEFSADDPNIKKALNWFVENQRKDGTWDLRKVRGGKDSSYDLWLTLAICRVFKRFHSAG